MTFQSVRKSGLRESRGPLSVWAVPNTLGYSRIGISIGRPCGNAVRRNRIKRLLRTAFRLMQHDFPCGYDWVITVRPHEPLLLADYQKILSSAGVQLHSAFLRRR
jgi:ribonuclease P protein component